MGKRGPKPAPTAALKLRGSWRAEARQGEPSVTPDLPDCPSWLRPEARQYWEEIGEMLAGLGIMGEPHSPALALLCDALADWLQFSDEADKADSFIKTDKGNLVQHPIHGMKNKAWQRVLSALREFGMTPSAISGIKSTAGKDDKPAKMNYAL